MKFFPVALLGLLMTLSGAQAQWITKTYPLASGWNGIWLAGDASYGTVVELLGTYTNITEVWRWNPNADQTQFSATPSEPSTTSEEWTVWKRDGTETQLSRLVGNSSYLIRCAGPVTLPLKQLALPPTATWLISGANFLGFPAAGDGTAASSPTLSNYFTSYPSASTTVLATGTKIFRYIGGELNSTNPMLINPATERLDSNKAYWFQVPTVGNFTAPVEYEVPGSTGLAYGRTLNTLTAGVTNRSTGEVTLNVTLENSEAAPANQRTVTGPVPLSRRTFNSTTNAYTETPVGTGFSITIPASGRANLDFTVDRSAITSSSAWHASILRIRDAAGLTDVRLPVSAQAATPAGLWIAQAKVSEVTSTTPLSYRNKAGDMVTSGKTTSQPFTLIYLMHVDSTGTARLLSQVFAGKLASSGNPAGLCITEKRILSHAASDVPPRRYFSCQLPIVPYINGTGTVSHGSSVLWRISVAHNDPTNPFVHTYHPDHDNLDATFTFPLDSGVESYAVTRDCSFNFTATPPDGSTVAGWGSTILGGTYAETLTGLNSKPLTVGGGFVMRRISEIPDIDLTYP